MLKCIYLNLVGATLVIVFYRYTDAAAFLLRLGLAADKCNASNSQCKVWNLND